MNIKVQRGKQSISISMFRNEQGAIDLASIMVGIIVIGLIGGLIAATVFAIIPWAQDNAAQQQLESINSAQSAYRGLGSTNPPSLPTGLEGNSFANSSELETAGLLKTGVKYCVVKTSDGQGWNAYSQSASGKVWTSSDSVTKPKILSSDLPPDCQFIGNPTGTPSAPPAPPASRLTTLTYQCDFDITSTIPMQDNLTGTETWDDGVTETYTNASMATERTLIGGTLYKVTFDGTYNVFKKTSFNRCLLSVDRWDSGVGVTDASTAFSDAIRLTSVPSTIPTSITNMSYMFSGATSFNQSIDSWDVSNVTSMTSLFESAYVFNQPLNSWNVSNVTLLNYVFFDASSFNQPLNNWNVSSASDMTAMFMYADSFNQPLNNWNVSNALEMGNMFARASVFNQPLNDWNMSRVRNTGYMFDGPIQFNQPLDKWDVSNVEYMRGMFRGNPSFNRDISMWNTSKVNDTAVMFAGATAFNQPLNSWNMSNVKDITEMFDGATAFNQPLNNWNVSSVTIMFGTFHNATAFNQPLNNWNTSNVINMNLMFHSNGTFVQDLSTWNTISVIDSNNFAPSSFPVGFLPPGVNPS